jgi:hypothetical protein
VKREPEAVQSAGKAWVFDDTIGARSLVQQRRAARGHDLRYLESAVSPEERAMVGVTGAGMSE